jgi:spoIIIJ-associated protein
MENKQTRVVIQAGSLEQAIVKAAGELSVNQEEVHYKVLKEADQKLFSFFSRHKVEIEAWTDEEIDKNGPNHRSLSTKQVADLEQELCDFCKGLCEQIAGEEVEVIATQVNGRLILDIENDYIASQINKNSKLAEALEHILRKKPRHLRQELPFRIFVDVSGIRQQREAELIQMAHDLSEKVHGNKRPIVLNYKSSYDRKIIHMALDKDDRVYTKSIGSGPNRKLMILPYRDQKQGRSQNHRQNHN